MAVSYITYAQLAEDVREFIRKLPRALIDNLCGVVGVPRSGMLPATMIANNLHLPLADSWSFAHINRFPEAGHRLTINQSNHHTILVVDDSIYAGTSINRALDRLKETYQNYNLKFVSAVLYRCPEKAAEVDYYLRDVPKPRYFEWNLLQHPDLPTFMLDLDGVLCYDPTVYDDDGPQYVNSLIHAEPLYLPKFLVHSICTMRLERHREVTERWLEDYNVRYGELIMVDLPTAQKRREQLNYAQWKGEKYKSSSAQLFIESAKEQAGGIQEYSGKPVICLENSKVYQ